VDTMDFIIKKEYKRYLLENDSGKIKIHGENMYDIRHFLDCEDALIEIEDYLEAFDDSECLEYFGKTYDEIIQDDDIIEFAIMKLISIRNDKKDIDDINQALQTFM
jgi:hypothetical protein